ncbi:MAG: bifunctional acetate--CoA ligase family protein/GNAT family N-acetyltransferase [Alphaproteobacteria bacterium]
MSIRDLNYLFQPRSIALVGASKSPNSVGAVLAHNLLQAGFDGPVMPVNPSHRSVAGVLTWPDVESLPIVPDMAVIATPPDTVAGVVAALREKGTKSAVIITAGFSGPDGSAEAQRKAELHKAAGRMRLLGPNVVGMILPHAGVNASFAQRAAIAGDLAFVSQSGAVLTSVLDWASARGIGFSHMISLGDKLDVDFGDILNYLTNDPKVRGILLYIEAISHSRKFMSAARAASRIKPVIVVKSGRHDEGAKAASSHTGALAGSDAVYDAAFKRAGMLRVVEMSDLFDAVETLSHTARHRRTVREGRLGILSNGGGIGVLATDRLIDLHGKLATLSPETVSALNEVLPATWSHANPVDIIGDATGKRYSDAFSIMAKDPQIDAILVLNCPTAIADSTEAAAAIVDAARAIEKPVFTSWLGEGAAANPRKLLRTNDIPSFETAEAAVRAFMHMVRYDRNQKDLVQVPPARTAAGPDARAYAKHVIDKALREGRVWLSEVEAKDILAAYGVPIVPTVVAQTPDEAEAAAKGFHFGDRIAVKILSKDITHKSDVGGVVLNLETPAQTREAAAGMLERLRKEYPDASIEGVTVQKMVQRPHAVELIVGLADDAQFGPVVMFGRGGKAVEVLNDTAMALPPLDTVLAHSLILQTDVARLLLGYRDQPPADIDALSDTLVTIGQIAVENPEIAELDINPLYVDESGVIALDARIKLAPYTGNPADRLAIRPYPVELESMLVLPGGEGIPVRPIKPEDAHALRAMIDRTDSEDIRLRFLHSIRRLPEQLAARLTQIDYDREMAFIALDPEDQAMIGVVRLAADPDGQKAEFGVLVRSDRKGIGLGHALMRYLIDYARNRHIGVLYGDVLAENSRMLHVCQDLGFSIRTSMEDPMLNYVELTLGTADSA